MKVHHCIAVEREQYALARGNCDIEYTVCQMTDGRRKTFEDGDPELEAYFADAEAYWASYGFVRQEFDGGRWGLTWVGKQIAEASRCGS